MKITNILAVGTLISVLTISGFGQHMHGKPEQQQEKLGKSGDMMGKPTAEQVVDGLRVQLWLITQDERKKMMEDRMKSGMGGMKHEMMGGMKDSSTMGHDMGNMKGMDHSKMGKDMQAGAKEMDHSKVAPEAHQPSAEMAGMMDGTHHVMVRVLDDKTGKAVGEGHIMISVTSPSGKGSMIHLSAMMDHFGGGASLNEKGMYKFALSFKSGDKTHKAQFVYEVK